MTRGEAMPALFRNALKTLRAKGGRNCSLGAASKTLRPALRASSDCGCWGEASNVLYECSDQRLPYVKTHSGEDLSGAMTIPAPCSRHELSTCETQNAVNGSFSAGR